MEVGTKLRGLRVEKGLSLREVGEMTGIAFSTMSRYERNMGVSDVTILNKLASFYGVSLDDVFDKPSQVDSKAKLNRAALNRLDEIEGEFGALVAELRGIYQSLADEEGSQ